MCACVCVRVRARVRARAQVDTILSYPPPFGMEVPMISVGADWGRMVEDAVCAPNINLTQCNGEVSSGETVHGGRVSRGRLGQEVSPQKPKTAGSARLGFTHKKPNGRFRPTRFRTRNLRTVRGTRNSAPNLGCVLRNGQGWAPRLRAEKPHRHEPPSLIAWLSS